jgi:hypothetical protein
MSMIFLKSFLGLWRDYQTFRRTMKEWLGDGCKPVATKISQERADMCLDCKFNTESVFVEAFGDSYIRHLEVKKRMKLEVVGESLLHTCRLCRCDLKLKIHVPFKHIRAYQREEIRQAIIKGKPTCWQLRNDS